MAYLVRLKRGWPGYFRRSVRRDPATGEQVMRGGEQVAVLRFTPGVAVSLSEEEFKAVEHDFPHTLEHVRLDEKNRPRRSDEPVQVDDSLVEDVDVEAKPAVSRRRRKKQRDQKPGPAPKPAPEPKPEPKPEPPPKVEPKPKPTPKPAPDPKPAPKPAADEIPPDVPEEMTPEFKPKGD